MATDTSMPLDLLDPVLPVIKVWVALHAPTAIKFIGVIVVGYLLARLARSLTRRLSERVGLDALTERVGLLPTLERVGVRSPSALLPSIIFWLCVAATIYLAADVIELDGVKRAVGAAMAFLPRLMTSLAILIAGLLGAELFKKVLHKALESREGSEELSALVPKVVQGTIVVLASAMAAEQLGLDVSLIHRLILVTAIAASLALGLSLALGGVMITRQLVSRYHVLRSFALDDDITLEGGQRGKIVRFAPTVVILEAAGGGEQEARQSTLDVSTASHRIFVPYATLIGAHVERHGRAHEDTSGGKERESLRT